MSTLKKSHELEITECLNEPRILDGKRENSQLLPARERNGEIGAQGFSYLKHWRILRLEIENLVGEGDQIVGNLQIYISYEEI